MKNVMKHTIKATFVRQTLYMKDNLRVKHINHYNSHIGEKLFDIIC